MITLDGSSLLNYSFHFLAIECSERGCQLLSAFSARVCLLLERSTGKAGG